MNKSVIREAIGSDLPAIIAMLANDHLGKSREVITEPPDQRYIEAFDAIERDPNQKLVVVEINRHVAGCLQLSLIPGLSRAGMWRGQIESVRVSPDFRGQGLGHLLISWAIDMARQRNCGLVQLTTDKSRPDALRFYQDIGFVGSHEGMKLSLD